MTINVLDTDAGIAAVLAARGERRRDALHDVLAPMEGMFRHFPGEVDLLQMHTMGLLGFPLDRDEDQTREALERLRAADAWGHIERALADAVDVQLRATPGIQVPDISVLLMLGDVGDEYFMGPSRGFVGSGGFSGYISLTLWPTEENLARLEALATHELNHNLRYAPGGVVWDPATVVVGEHVVSEGLADAFARQLHGDAGYTSFGLPHLHDDAVFAKVVAGLEVGGMENFTAWVLGDESARRFGSEPVGLPMGAGYAVGNRLVDAYLSATGQSAAEALHAPSRDVIEAALAR